MFFHQLTLNEFLAQQEKLNWRFAVHSWLKRLCRYCDYQSPCLALFCSNRSCFLHMVCVLKYSYVICIRKDYSRIQKSLFI